MAYRYGKKIRKKTMFWEAPPEGTEEEKMEAAEIIKDYTYKLLDYADKDELPEKEVADHKRLYIFARQGPRAWGHRFNSNNKLTSADVLYILTTTQSSYKLGELFGVDPRKIRMIRRDEYPCWEWEYTLIRKLKAIIRTNMQTKELSKGRKLYIVCKQIDKDRTEEIFYVSSLSRAKRMREEMLTKKEYTKLIKDDTLDILYPIKETELV